jgi:hypothetical protein
MVCACEWTSGEHCDGCAPAMLTHSRSVLVAASFPTRKHNNRFDVAFPIDSALLEKSTHNLPTDSTLLEEFTHKLPTDSALLEKLTLWLVTDSAVLCQHQIFTFKAQRSLVIGKLTTC